MVFFSSYPTNYVTDSCVRSYDTIIKGEWNILVTMVLLTLPTQYCIRPLYIHLVHRSWHHTSINKARCIKFSYFIKYSQNTQHSFKRNLTKNMIFFETTFIVRSPLRTYIAKGLNYILFTITWAKLEIGGARSRMCVWRAWVRMGWDGMGWDRKGRQGKAKDGMG